MKSYIFIQYLRMSFPTLKINQSKYLYDVFCNVVVNLTCSQDITQTLPKAINSQGIEWKHSRSKNVISDT